MKCGGFISDCKLTIKECTQFNMKCLYSLLFHFILYFCIFFLDVKDISYKENRKIFFSNINVLRNIKLGQNIKSTLKIVSIMKMQSLVLKCETYFALDSSITENVYLLQELLCY